MPIIFLNHHVGFAARLSFATIAAQPQATKNNINHKPKAYKNTLTLHFTIDTGKINAMITAYVGEQLENTGHKAAPNTIFPHRELLCCPSKFCALYMPVRIAICSRI